MKKLLIILSLFLTAFSTLSVMPPGWYQQTLPVNDFVNDFYFVDTLNGWIVTDGRFNTNDTAYIMRTTNGGDNWIVQKSRMENLNVLQFFNINTGYAAGGLNGTTTLSLYKTTNGGNNWNAITTLGGVKITDISFINVDTGWVCDDNTLTGGLYKTTNGGGSWIDQWSIAAEPYSLFFINKDTGWTGTNEVQSKLYRTTNGGVNWIQQYVFSGQINDVFFFNGQKGILTSETNFYTTNGGANWVQCSTNVGGVKISFANDTVGWAGNNFNKMSKTTNGGITWFHESAPIFTSFAVSAPSYNKAWAGGSGIIKTDGLTGIQQISHEQPGAFKLFQNYPNPFNPKTIINYQCSMASIVELKVYDITGKIIAVLVNERQTPGTYQYTFDGTELSSGIYFYKLEAENFTEVKRMVLVK